VGKHRQISFAERKSQALKAKKRLLKLGTGGRRMPDMKITDFLRHDAQTYGVPGSPSIERILEVCVAAANWIDKLESSRWELFDDLSTAYYGKVMYGLNDDGTVYSRYSCDTMPFDQAVDEFRRLIADE
jgi:hypothetical protein